MERPRLLRNAILAATLPASDAASRLCGEALPPPNADLRVAKGGKCRFRTAAKRPGGADRHSPKDCVAKRLRFCMGLAKPPLRLTDYGLIGGPFDFAAAGG